MQFTAALAAVVVVAAGLMGGTTAQLAVGPNGVSTPPINLLAVFRLVRQMISRLAADTPVEAEVKEATAAGDEIENGFLQRDSFTKLLDIPEAKCPPGGCLEGLEVFPADISSQLLVGKWPLAYIAFIIVTSILILVISIPYVITGETFRSYESAALPFPDQEDAMLLLTWLLGEASGDTSCLERAVCLTPDRSARYLTFPSALATFFPRWIPHRYQEQLKRLDEVTENGLNDSCHQYSCSALPNL